MRRVVRSMASHAVTVAFALVLAGGALVAQQEEASVSDGWVKLPAAGETSALAFARVKNPTMYDVYLVSVTTEVAEKVEFRRSADEAMAEVTVPAYGAVGMAADGLHLLLTELKRPLEIDERITLTLKTSDGVSMTVAAVVRDE